MNFHHVMSQYKDTDITSKVEGASKHEFIKIVLEELFLNLTQVVSRLLQVQLHLKLMLLLHLMIIVV